ncbi:MAG: AraC family transcriptional regulator [Oscillospiraceae bacterium]|nr:AraC family transcriptional regulator [Oscillospiraceae bacterium]
MDLIQKMNEVVEYVEKNLTDNIDIEALSRIAGCSAHEFSHIFSFMAGMSVSEYIRRRRLSQAVFDIQNGNEGIIDISLKYCYPKPHEFTRAFKELHKRDACRSS